MPIGPSYKLGQIIWLRKIIQKCSVLVLIFGPQIRSKQASLFISHTKWISFLKLNTVEWCWIMVIWGHFCSFLSHFDMFDAWFDMNKKLINYLFWTDISDLIQIIYWFWFVGIQHYLTFNGKACQIICSNLLCFNWFYDLN